MEPNYSLARMQWKTKHRDELCRRPFRHWLKAQAPQSQGAAKKLEPGTDLSTRGQCESTAGKTLALHRATQVRSLVPNRVPIWENNSCIQSQE